MRNAVVAVFCIMLCGCSGPMGPIAGGKLEGTPSDWPTDWAFTDDIENVLLETNPNDPYSVTIWIVVVNGTPYIASASHETHWAQNIEDNSNVIVSVQGQLIDAKATMITSNENVPDIISAYLTKYDMEEEDFVEQDGVLFVLSQR